MIRLEKLGYFTAKEAAEYLGISLRTLHNWLERGSIQEPILRQNRLLVWKKSQIEKEMKQRGGLPYNGNRATR